MRKVLIIIPSLNVGGLERMAVNVSNALSQIGWDVTVMNLTSHNDEIVKSFNNRVRYISQYSPKPFLLHASFKYLIKFNFRIFPLEKWFYLHNAEYIHKVYVKGKYDVEIAFYYGKPAQIVAGAPNGVKKVFWVHEIPSAVRQKDSNRVRIKSEHEAIDKMDLAICVSERFKDEFKLNYLCRNVISIPNLQDYNNIIEKGNEQINDVKKKRFTFIFVGRLDIEHKGIDRLLDAVDYLNHEGLFFDFWIIGDGVDCKQIKDVVLKKKLDNIQMLGLKDNPYPYIKNADALVLTSRWEAYGLVMAESLILGTPVIATECDGSKDVLENGRYGLLVKNSLEGIIDGLKCFLSNEKEYAHYLKAAKERSEYFKSDKIIKRINEALLNE